MVPPAQWEPPAWRVRSSGGSEGSADSYYGRPILKAPRWKSPHLPAYLFLGGLSGASAVMGALADGTGRPHLARVGRLASLVGVAGGAGALVAELGRPERFLNMLRVFKPTSPMSVGSWTLAVHGGLVGAAGASEIAGIARGAGRLAGAGAALTGPVAATYTGVLLANTAVPAWHEAQRELPFLFAGGAVSAAGGLGLVAAPLAETAPARRMVVLGSVVELAAERRISTGLGLVGEPYHVGRAGRWMRAARVLTAAGAFGAVLGRRSRAVSALAGTAVMAGSICTRFGVYEAGMISAGDPRYVVVPQRERLGERRVGGNGGG